MSSALTSLSLGICRNITDVGLKELRHMPKLNSLDLSQCFRITDEGLMELGHMSDLKLPNLPYCCWITDAGQRDLIEQLPFLSRPSSAIHSKGQL